VEFHFVKQGDKLVLSEIQSKLFYQYVAKLKEGTFIKATCKREGNVKTHKQCREFARGGQPNPDYCGEGGTGEPSPTDDDIPF